MSWTLKNTDERYGLVAQLLHWAVVTAIALQYVWAWRVDRTDSIRQQFSLINEHKSIGMLILMLVLLRLGWRAINRTPRFPIEMKRWEINAANVTHVLLYSLLLAMPLTGWMYSSAAGYGAEFFGWLDIPDFVSTSEALESIMHRSHTALSWALPAVVALHVLAALRHHFVLKDDVLKRMLPGSK